MNCEKKGGNNNRLRQNWVTNWASFDVIAPRLASKRQRRRNGCKVTTPLSISSRDNLPGCPGPCSDPRHGGWRWGRLEHWLIKPEWSMNCDLKCGLSAARTDNADARDGGRPVVTQNQGKLRLKIYWHFN